MSTLIERVNALTSQTTALFDITLGLNGNLENRVAAAVVVSENAAIVPLVTMAAHLINTQALLVTYIARG